jgi:hypothetical protein
MAQVRIQDGLSRLVEHFLQGDDEAIASTLELCKVLIERLIPHEADLEVTTM